jgi:thiazole synthase
MKTNAFLSLKEVIEKAGRNEMLRDAKLIMLGRIIELAGTDSLTNDQGYELEDLMGGRDQFEPAMSYALLGEDLNFDETT